MENKNENPVYLGIGTNLGDKRENLEAALNSLAPHVALQAVSRLYETAPAYVLDQPPFYNIAVKGQTALPPVELLAFLKNLEEELGREKVVRYGPRKIDMDLLFYGDLALDLPQLQIPHPRISERAFVLRPLADLSPQLLHPVTGQSVLEMADALPEDDGILRVHNWQPQIRFLNG
jgi:2-amino-4-hydroxy-6-hydroxymethyldihydropteridine diphosphokinase